MKFEYIDTKVHIFRVNTTQSNRVTNHHTQSVSALTYASVCNTTYGTVRDTLQSKAHKNGKLE